MSREKRGCPLSLNTRKGNLQTEIKDPVQAVFGGGGNEIMCKGSDQWGEELQGLAQVIKG